MKLNALIIPLVFGIPLFTILNANLSFVQFFQPGLQNKLLLPNAHPNKKGTLPNTIIDQNKAPTTTTTTIIALLSTNNTCNNNNRNHNSC
jgi:hypothetical protein